MTLAELACCKQFCPLHCSAPCFKLTALHRCLLQAKCTTLALLKHQTFELVCCKQWCTLHCSAPCFKLTALQRCLLQALQQLLPQPHCITVSRAASLHRHWQKRKVMGRLSLRSLLQAFQQRLLKFTASQWPLLQVSRKHWQRRKVMGRLSLSSLLHAF